MLLLIVLLFGVPAIHALADNADRVEIAGVALTVSHPHWKSGGGATADNWEACFDTGSAAPILRLKNAAVDAANAIEEMIYANGDIVLELLEKNTLMLTGGGYLTPAGMTVEGTLTITNGTGSLYVLV